MPARVTIHSSRFLGQQERTVEFVEGNVYVVKPHNPRKKKHRDRKCIFHGIVSVSETSPKDHVAKVRFLDNNRLGRVELADLVSLEVIPPESENSIEN
jgi:hypothetical protein